MDIDLQDLQRICHTMVRRNELNRCRLKWISRRKLSKKPHLVSAQIKEYVDALKELSNSNKPWLRKLLKKHKLVINRNVSNYNIGLNRITDPERNLRLFSHGSYTRWRSEAVFNLAQIEAMAKDYEANLAIDSLIGGKNARY